MNLGLLIQIVDKNKKLVNWSGWDLNAKLSAYHGHNTKCKSIKDFRHFYQYSDFHVISHPLKVFQF